MKFEPTLDSVRTHRMPPWFSNAKLGIFIHWGLYSVPGWAPHGEDIDRQVAEHGWRAMFANNPYAEWYLNTYRLGDTPTRRHHIATYGPQFSYDDFVPMFNRAVEKWNPDDWASLFQKIGARYVVLTTKHHEGFLLWPSKRTSPHRQGKYATDRDLVGELTQSVRQRGMKMGLYYSGGLDWTFNPKPVEDDVEVRGTIVQSQEFIDYANGHFYELIDRYAPSILWNDIGYPAKANSPELFAYYYNTVPDGVVNDRWSQKPQQHSEIFDAVSHSPADYHFDYTTPEYNSYREIVEKPWEACRGIGHSFGYNQNEGPDDYLSVEKLVHLLVDIVSKNGNLLLDVGPMADGTIPELQRERLNGLGEWLAVNGEAIFDTAPWVVAEGKTGAGTDVRFTQKEDSLYAILLGMPAGERVSLDMLQAGENTVVSLLGHGEPLSVQRAGRELSIALPRNAPRSPALALKITPKPKRAGQ